MQKKRKTNPVECPCELVALLNRNIKELYAANSSTAESASDIISIV